MSDHYITSDFPTVAFILSHDMDIIDVRRGQGGRLEFVFADRLACQQLASDLLLGEDTVSARRHMAAIRQAKRIIHSVP